MHAWRCWLSVCAHVRRCQVPKARAWSGALGVKQTLHMWTAPPLPLPLVQPARACSEVCYSNPPWISARSFGRTYQGTRQQLRLHCAMKWGRAAGGRAQGSAAPFRALPPLAAGCARRQRGLCLSRTLAAAAQLLGCYSATAPLNLGGQCSWSTQTGGPAGAVRRARGAGAH